MARRFNRTEKQRIRAKLLMVGLQRFARQGVRAVRIDDLALDAGISKGSFYTFFSSKEDLFMAMTLERELKHREDMRQLLAKTSIAPDVQAANIFDLLIEKIKTDPVLSLIIKHGEIEYLTRKISPEQMLSNAKSDRLFIEELTGIWNKNNPECKIDADILSGLLTLMIALMMQAHLLTWDKLSEALALLRDTFITKLSSPSNPIKNMDRKQEAAGKTQ